MDHHRDIHVATDRLGDNFQGGDSCEDTRVPNSPVLPTLKPTSTSPSDDSLRGSITLDDPEKGEILSIPSSTRKSRIRRHFHDEVSRDWADVVLLLCWFTTGFLDSTIFNGMLGSSHRWRNTLTKRSMSAYGSFVSMQTGM